METKEIVKFGEKQILKRGYITNALTNEKGRVFGMILDCYINDFSDEGKAFYWSEVYCEPDYMCQIVRKGTLLCNATNDELQKYHKHSKINLH